MTPATCAVWRKLQLHHLQTSNGVQLNSSFTPCTLSSKEKTVQTLLSRRSQLKKQYSNGSPEGQIRKKTVRSGSSGPDSHNRFIPRALLCTTFNPPGRPATGVPVPRIQGWHCKHCHNKAGLVDWNLFSPSAGFHPGTTSTFGLACWKCTPLG